MNRSENGFGLLSVILTLLVISIVAGAGWYVWSQNPKQSLSSSGNNDVTVEQNDDANEAEDPYAGWAIYKSETEGLSFKYPADWVKKESKAVNGQSDAAEFTSPSGTVVVWSSYVDGLGGYCDPAVEPHVLVEESHEISSTPPMYVVELIQGNSTRLGIINDVNGKQPTVGDTGLCILYTTFESKDGERTMWLQTQRDQIKASDVETVKKILSSVKY